MVPGYLYAVAGVQCDTHSPMQAKKRQLHLLVDRNAPYHNDVHLVSVGTGRVPDVRI